MRARAVFLAGLVLLGGCSSGDDEKKRRADSPALTKPSEPERIRAWSKALNDGDFEEAASFFAKNAIVEQTQELRLGSRDAAVAFNRSLPCKADVTDIEKEGETFLVAFRLRDGPGGPCSGAARVRFRFEGARFSEWRQLGEPPRPEGDIAWYAPSA